jgi:membrane protein YdbS with pleckstrin-like domain
MFRINANENILASYRRHWVMLFVDVFFIFIIALVVILAVILINKFIPSSFDQPFASFMIWLILLLYHGLWIGLFIKLADYWLDTWIITNERVIDIEQKGLFRREVSEFKIDKIQDVSIDVSGVIQTLFSYGDVQIQTAGSDRVFVFKTVPNPQEIKNKILKTHDEYKHSQKKQ